MVKLLSHHRQLMRRIGFATHSGMGRPLHSRDLLPALELAATDINYGRDTHHQSPRLHLAHRVRIMEPGSSRAHFIDCEVPV